MKPISLWLFLALSVLGSAADLPLDGPAWRRAVFDFTAKRLVHSAWGLAHSKRDYFLALEVAARENLKVDEEVLFAAAMIHDMGGFPEFAKPGVDHADRSAQLADSVLGPMGFPETKLPQVKEAILTHSYYCPMAPRTPEAIALHDADTLDFLGLIGLERIVSLTMREAVAKDLLGAIRTTQRLLQDAPKSLVLSYSRGLGKARAREMSDALKALEGESYGWDAL